MSSLIIIVALTSSALAVPQKEKFRNWTASLDEVNTGEDLRKTCSAWSTAKDAAGREWTLKLAIANGDALPPDAYPQISIAAAAGAITGNGSQSAVFGFGDTHVDAQVSGSGNEVMVSNDKATSLRLLKAFAQGSSLDLALAAEAPVAFSLVGFTASYRKLGAWCGFPTQDVAK
jgi:hypothetical protein